MRGSRSFTKFAGTTQRIIILEGAPETELAALARLIKEEIPDHCKILNLPVNPEHRTWSPEELSDEVFEFIDEEPDKILIVSRFSVPERERGLPDPVINIYSQIEQALGEFPTFAFFVLGTRHYYTKIYNNIPDGLAAMERQPQFEKAYKETKHPRKLFLQATGYNLSDLASTVLYQADVYIKNPDINWDETE